MTQALTLDLPSFHANEWYSHPQNSRQYAAEALLAYIGNYIHIYRPQRKLRKVMFSEASVSHSVHEGGISGPMSFLGVGISGSMSFLEGGYLRSHNLSRVSIWYQDPSGGGESTHRGGCSPPDMGPVQGVGTLPHY